MISEGELEPVLSVHESHILHCMNVPILIIPSPALKDSAPVAP